MYFCIITATVMGLILSVSSDVLHFSSSSTKTQTKVASSSRDRDHQVAEISGDNRRVLSQRAPITNRSAHLLILCDYNGVDIHEEGCLSCCAANQAVKMSIVKFVKFNEQGRKNGASFCTARNVNIITNTSNQLS